MPPIKTEISGTTKLFGCLAHPTSHVRAPSLFNRIFADNHQDGVMVPVDIAPEMLAEGVAGLKAMPNFLGAAVTIPHKMPMAELCDELGAVAQITGAVNAIRFDKGRILGDNFDGAGFVAGLAGQGHQLEGKKCLLIGAGGAARAIAYALCGEAIASLDVTNRSLAKADDLVAAVREHRKSAPLNACQTPDYGSYDIVINATSLGLHETDAMPCDPQALSQQALVCDIIMVPEQTSWLKAAQNRGIAVHYGRHMLDYQIALIGAFIGADTL